MFALRFMRSFSCIIQNSSSAKYARTRSNVTQDSELTWAETLTKQLAAQQLLKAKHGKQHFPLCHCYCFELYWWWWY